VIPDERQQIAYFKTSGPTALAYRDKELIGHGALNYPQGFGSPVGKLKGINLAIEDMYPRDLEAYDIYEGRQVRLEFEGQIVVEGEVITGIRNLQGKILLIRFRNCLVSCRDHILFTPDEGLFNMAVGKEVVSGYAGPADLNSFDLISHQISEPDLFDKKELSELRRESAYRQIRDFRQMKSQPEPGIRELISQIIREYPREWLLLLECREVLLAQSGQEEMVNVLTHHLETLAHNWPERAHLILEGLAFENSLS
jgi:phenylalanine-4-hydroxylase